MKIERIIYYIAIVVMAYFLFRGCHGSPVPDQPKVETAKEQAAKVKEIVVNDQHKEDSLLRIAQTAEQDAQNAIAAYTDLERKYNAKAGTVKQQATATCPDLVPQLDSLAAIRTKEQAAKNKQVAALNKQISTKADQLKNAAKVKAQLLSRIDTCMLNQKALQDYAKSIKPRLQVLLSGEVFGGATFGYAVGAGIRLKNGVTILAKAYIINGVQNYGGQIIYPISFRKR